MNPWTLDSGQVLTFLRISAAIFFLNQKVTDRLRTFLVEAAHPYLSRFIKHFHQLLARDLHKGLALFLQRTFYGSSPILKVRLPLSYAFSAPFNYEYCFVVIPLHPTSNTTRTWEMARDTLRPCVGY